MALTAAELRAFYSVDESELDKSLGGLPGKVKAGFGALAAVGGIAGLTLGSAIGEGMDQERLGDKLAAQLGATGPQAAQLGKVAGDLYSHNYGDSLSQVDDALKGVMQSGILAANATGAQMQDTTGKVLTLASAFDVDLGGATNAVGQLMRTGLAKNANEAFDIITRGMQTGANKSGDFLDTLNEYSTQFRKLGLDGATATGLISQGLQAGARDSDLVADAIKEFSIRAVDGSTTTAQGFKDIGLNAKTMAEQIARGGPSASAALQLTLDKLRGIKDPALQAQAAVALFGSQAEEMGAALYSLDPSHAVSTLGQVKGALDGVGQTLNDNASTRLDGFKRAVSQAFVQFLGSQAIPFIERAATVIGSVLGPALSWLGGFLSGVVAPAISNTFGFLAQHSTTVQIIAGVIGGVLLPVLVAWGVQSTAAAAKSVAAWATTQATAIGSSWAQVGAAGRVVGGWVLMATQAVAQGAVQAAVWTGQVVAQAVSGAVSFGVQVARVVAGWVLMGVQSLIQAARMAAAWVIAMGPVGWVIAAVVGLVALIVANWDSIVQWTTSAWNAVTGALSAAWVWIKSLVFAAVTAVVGWILGAWNNVVNTTTGLWNAISGVIGAAWNWIKGVVMGAVNAVVGAVTGAWNWIVNITQAVWNTIVGAIRGAWNWITGAVRGAVSAVTNAISGAWNWALGVTRNVFGAIGGAIRSAIDTVVGIVSSLPGKIGSFFANAGSWLLDAGKRLLQGLWNGISGAAGWLWDQIQGWISGIKNKVLGFFGIASPSKMFADIGKNLMLGLGQGINRNASTAVDAAMAAASQVTSAMNPTAGIGIRAPLGTPTAASLAAMGNTQAANGALFHADNVNLIEGTPRDVAEELAYKARTRGMG